jgi:hypothetical protein
MKKHITISILAALYSAVAFGQNCNLSLKDGSKVNLNIVTWTTPLMSDPKFQKAKDEKKEEQVMKFNADAMAGTLPAASSYPMTYTAKKTTTPDGDEYVMTTIIADKEYNSYVRCANDTMYLCRNRGPIIVPDGKGGIYGYAIQGVQKVPINLKVGDELPSYEDINIVFPTSTDEVVKKQVFSHNSTSTSHEFGFATDSHTGETGFGNYTKTTTKAVYKMIDVAVRKTLSSSGHTINYVRSEVTGEEDVTVGGVKYKGYVIESETWSKQTAKVDYESVDEEVNKQQKAMFDKGQTKLSKLMVKKGFTNDLGYSVMYKREVFVPAIGMVKTQGYDLTGALTGEITIAGIE